MDKEAWKELVARNAEEIVTTEELDALYEKPDKKAYIGFEPSGLAHIGWVIQANKVKDLQKAGFRVIIYLADWHAYINDKLGGDIESIQACGRYMEECFLALGVDPTKTDFIYASKLLDAMDYWERVLRISKKTSLQRMRRALTIMGRKEEESEMDSSKLIYPSMQAADIFQMDVDLALGGMDQRKAHMLARDAADKLGWKKFVALHTPLLASLQGGERMDPIEAKMSKSDPNAAIFIHDSEEDIKRKVKKGYCPQGVADGNPVLDIARYIIFPAEGKLHIDRPEKFGGPLEYDDFESLKNAFVDGSLHPMDLKMGAASSLSRMLAPVREHFAAKPDNLRAVESMTITR
ncbi:MAG: tyrosine--tRNA ligase [Candidatus Thermoplasmatota archaeon]|nr:tyrosine--tRNA ligase [Candidatus Thermoplasmatota archaeon]